MKNHKNGEYFKQLESPQTLIKRWKKVFNLYKKKIKNSRNWINLFAINICYKTRLSPGDVHL